MSVFTALTANDIRRFLSGFEVGALLDWQGVPGGSENTNYFLDCDTGGYVLTLIERGSAEDLSFFLSLLDCLHQSRIPVPYAIRDRQGKALQTLKRKPALLQPRFRGTHHMQPDEHDCAALGRMLARLHATTEKTDLHRDSDRGLRWVLRQSRTLLRDRWRDEAAWLEPELVSLQSCLSDLSALPETVIHGDLFRDNVLFDGARISGVIDFYNASTGPKMLDLAICYNDWCMEKSGRDQTVVNRARAGAMLEGYWQEQSPTAQEDMCWRPLLKLAALRFWVSRELATMGNANQTGVLVKDPARFRHLFRCHCENPEHNA